MPYLYKPKFYIAAYDRDPLSFSSELVGDWSKFEIKKILFDPVMKKFKKNFDSDPMLVRANWP